MLELNHNAACFIKTLKYLKNSRFHKEIISRTRFGGYMGHHNQLTADHAVDRLTVGCAGALVSGVFVGGWGVRGSNTFLKVEILNL